MYDITEKQIKIDNRASRISTTFIFSAVYVAFGLGRVSGNTQYFYLFFGYIVHFGDTQRFILKNTNAHKVYCLGRR